MNEGRTRRPIYQFGDFVLDLERGALFAASGSEVSLRPKAFSLLLLFVENAGRLIDRGMIIEALWSGTFVTDESVAQCVKDVRRGAGRRGATSGQDSSWPRLPAGSNGRFWGARTAAAAA